MALAIIAVLLNHFLQSLVPTSFFERASVALSTQSGWGIASFLTLSGFLVGSSLYKQTRFTLKEGFGSPSPGRRACGVLLLYYAILAVTLPAAAAPWPPDGRLFFARHPLLAPAFPLAFPPHLAIAQHGQWLFYGDQINLVHLLTVSLQEQFVLLAAFSPPACSRNVPNAGSFAAAGHRCPHECCPRHVHRSGYTGLSLYRLHLRPHRQLLRRAALAWAWRRGINLEPPDETLPPSCSSLSGTLVWIALACLQSPPLGRSVHVHAGLLPSSRDTRRNCCSSFAIVHTCV